jgi:hypothetical protein
MVLSVKICVSGRDDMQFCILVQFGAQILNSVKRSFSLVIFLAMCPHWTRLVAVLILVYCFGCVKQLDEYKICNLQFEVYVGLKIYFIYSVW